ncbi:MAG: hypothetical protein ACLFUE_07535 [Desulfobacteraceae bacterium]
MKGLEVIRVQSSSSLERDLEKRLFNVREEVLQGPTCAGLVAFIPLRQADMPGSFAIHLLWDSEVPASQGSALGWNLMEILKEFGLVNHSVWLAASPEGLSSWDTGTEDG